MRGWGAGLIVNPTTNASVTVGYEGSRFNTKEYGGEGKISTNGFNVTVGYRF
ncbi:Ail/Lom family outer membrane beta-barrel protein [Photorhabdus heterorhabditis]|uniref:Ail/Lom family outer membrane beta-barrel protein n=1 Tax=Photorhabdus heterorhabditis TaxID=880156 RepID=UPI001561CD58|nr:Ail/Lom family outer membrane beta-barrel protein [Photorhabdus heterorhabditis subsp. aluminescens]